MSTLGIVVLSIIAGLLLAGLLAIGGLLAWMQWRLSKLVTGLQTSFPLLLTELEGKLAKQTELLDGKLGQINGERLAKASADCISAARRIESASLAFADLAKHLLSGEALEVEQASRAGLAAEDYAPNPSGESYVSQSKVSAADALVDNEEQAAALAERHW